MSTADATVDEDVEVRSPLLELLRRFVAGDLAELRVVLALAVIWLVFYVQEPRFMSSVNLSNLVLQMTAVGLVSVGIVLVLLLGEIDLSVGAVSGLARRDHGGAERAARLVPVPGDRRGGRGGHGHRALPGVGVHALRGPVVRGDPGRPARVAGGAAEGARRDGHREHQRPEDPRADEHLLQRHGGVDPRARSDRRLRGVGAARAAEARLGGAVRAAARPDRAADRRSWPWRP